MKLSQRLFETWYQIGFDHRGSQEVGITVSQIDEAALREGLPFRMAEHAFYLDLAFHSFGITDCSIVDMTQVHAFRHIIGSFQCIKLVGPPSMSLNFSENWFLK